MPKNSVGESFTVASISGTEKVWIRGGGGGEYQDLLSKFFCLTVSKLSVGESFIAAIISGTEKSLDKKGGGSINIFRRNFFVSLCRSFLWGNPLRLQ